MVPAPLGFEQPSLWHLESDDPARCSSSWLGRPAPHHIRAHPTGGCSAVLRWIRSPCLDRLHDSCQAEEYRDRFKMARTFLSGDPPTLKEVRRQLGTGVLATESVVTAIYLFCRFNDDFEAMIEFTCSLVGDTDTIGAMAGGIFGALRGKGALPAEPMGRLEERDRLKALGRELYLASTS